MTEARGYAKVDMYKNDSREKLEHDIRFGSTMTMYSNSYETEVTAKWSDIIGWLDRQAAITEREVKLRELYKFEENHREHVRSIEEVNQKLNERIAGLKESRRRQAKTIREMSDANDELVAERDDLQAKVDALESRHCEWSDPDNLGDGCMLRHDELVDELKREAEGLRAELSEYRAALNKASGNWARADERAQELEAEAGTYRENMLAQSNRVAELQAMLSEYDETHMKLPVDADGVPIHVGDELRSDPCKPSDACNTGGTVTGIAEGTVFLDHGCWGIRAGALHHVKPRTVEDVLQEFAERVLHSGHQWGFDAGEHIDKYEGELRWLGVDDD